MHSSTPCPKCVETEKFSAKLLPGRPRITGSGRVTSCCPQPDKKGRWKRYAVEMWILQEARIEAAGNINVSIALANIHAHNWTPPQSQFAHDVLEFGVTPDCFGRLSNPALIADDSQHQTKRPSGGLVPG